MSKEFTIIKISQDNQEILKDLVAEEIPLTININGQELVTLLVSPLDLEDLVVGFLYSSGLIKKFSDITDIFIDTKLRSASVELKDKLDNSLVFKRLFTSGCGRGVIFYNALDLAHRTKLKSDFKIPSKAILNLMREFQKKSSEFKQTGGTHSAGLSCGKTILIFKEDIGRHNAVDKVIGRALAEKRDFSKSLILTSGRISSEIVSKVKKAAIPIIVSQGAPTDQAIKLARSFDLALFGFVRSNRMNIYSAKQRLG